LCPALLGLAQVHTRSDVVGGGLEADDSQPAASGQTAPSVLEQLSPAELAQIDVTSPSKEPTPAFHSPTAIYVTGDDIRRSGVATTHDCA